MSTPGDDDQAIPDEPVEPNEPVEPVEPAPAGTPATAPANGLTPGAHRLAAVPRDSIVTVALVAVLVVAGLAVAVWSSRGGDDEPATASASATAETTGTATVDATPEPTTPTPTPTPTGIQVPELSLPTLKQVDRNLGRRGLERVGQDDVESLSFVVTSFNVLGASHTRGPGARPGFAAAEARLPAQVAELDRKQVSVAGLQEFQYPQVAQLRSLTGDEWGIFPGTSLGERLADNSIIWRQSLWKAVRTETIDIPYFGGAPTPMPYVLLQHRETGRRVWFGNFHNPANIGGNEAGNRQRALELEADLSNRLSEDGTPVVITGDMNDRGAFACPFAERSGMVSADGARHSGGQCLTPRQMNVDWIWGTTDLGFGDFLTDYGVQDRKLTDHPMITATASLVGAESREGCTSRITRSGVFWFCPTADA